MTEYLNGKNQNEIYPQSFATYVSTVADVSPSASTGWNRSHVIRSHRKLEAVGNNAKRIFELGRGGLPPSEATSALMGTLITMAGGLLKRLRLPGDTAISLPPSSGGRPDAAHKESMESPLP